MRKIYKRLDRLSNVFRKSLLPLVVFISASAGAQINSQTKPAPKISDGQSIEAIAALWGKVTDEQTGESLVGVSLALKGTSFKAITDVEGRFRFAKLPAGNQTLLISYIGYKTKAVEISETTGQLSIALESSSTNLGQVTITGLRRSQIQSINQKKQALNIKEVITANEAGKLPDINVAEATQRVSGVSIETDRGEGQFVSIRGIQPSLNNVTLNNTTLASTTNSRATALDLLPTEIISSIEIVKSTTPDMEGNAIGGSININTLSAFSKPKPFFIASLDGLHQVQQVNLSGFDKIKTPFRGAVTAGKKFGAKEQFGAVISANYFRRDFSASVLDPDGWEYNKYFYPNEIELQIEGNERDRMGISADFEFRPTLNNSVYLKTLYTRTNEIAKNSEFELTMQISGAQPLDQTATSGRFAKGSGELDQAYSDETENLYNYTLGTRNRFGRLSTDVYGTYSRAKTLLDNFDGTFENPKSTEPQLSLKYNTQPFFFEITPENPEFASNPEIYKLRNLNFTTGTVLEDVYEFSADLKYDFNLGSIPAYLKFGGRYRDRSKVVDRATDAYDLKYGDVNIANEDAYSLTPFYFPTSAPAQGGAMPFVHGNVNKFKDFAYNPANTNNESKIVRDKLETAIRAYENDLNNSETVSAGYVMGVMNFKKITAIGGLRVERTSTESNNAEVIVDEEESEVENALLVKNARLTNSYTNFLPSLQLKANITPNFIARAAWTNTIGRPDYSQLSATTQYNYAALDEEDENDINFPDQTHYEGDVTLANPGLKPYYSSNFDISLERYFSKGGMIAIGGFYKRIKNPIYEIETPSKAMFYEGKYYEELTFSQDLNAGNANLLGLEVSYDQPLTFLPGVFNGLGIGANFALIESKVNLSNFNRTDDIPMFRQANNVYNAALYYQKKGYELRLATSHRSKYLTSVANPADYEEELKSGISVSEFDRYEAPRTTYDLSGSYSFKKHYRITAQVRNLTNEAEQAYQGRASRYDRHDLTGRSFFLGMSMSF
ncbi:TonB-dependent receptor [Paradesertivirga mongoliensis]|uniref:TonB-dependent receptor n=1 Tax=Paradesertivirga mongoliensis TaxID=2100740 RepID=A0ABW4ZGP8_9SPHI|nr:TonB-dependent receptor [Pedobacter mongoliensis]